jgi:DNA ligase 1
MKLNHPIGKTDHLSNNPMKKFAGLFTELDQTTKTLRKIQALVDYFEVADDRDKLWAIALLIEKRPRRTVRINLLKEWAAELANIPYWLFEESYHVVGDLAETLSLIHPGKLSDQDHSLAFWMDYIGQMATLDDARKKDKIIFAWNTMDQMERFVFNKLITGGFRIGISQKLLVRALAKFSDQDENILAHRLTGKWSPEDTDFHELVFAESHLDDLSKPYPFFLAYALDKKIEELGEHVDWLAERKWDGIRGQLIFRDGKLFLWSRGEELVTEKFPEYEVLKAVLPDGIAIDGEILSFQKGRPLPFNALQTRIGRKNLSPAILKKAPAIMMAYDLLEYEGNDIRQLPLMERRKLLEQLVLIASSPVLLLSVLVPFDSWGQLAVERSRSREFLCEGLMIKRKNSSYQTGRRKGDWWKWKIDPFTVDAVLIYAMRGHGRRANLYTDYTFAVWDGDDLVPFTKAYSGLTDEEIRQVDRYVKQNTIDRFGPVRSVVPKHVFEIAFEGIQKSTRHKSGVALRFPRINRWRPDKKIEEANTLAELHQLMEIGG